MDDECELLPKTSASLEPTRRGKPLVPKCDVKGRDCSGEWIFFLAGIVLLVAAVIAVVHYADATKRDPNSYKNEYEYRRHMLRLKAEYDFKKIQEGK